MNSHRTSHWLLLCLFFSSALGLPQVLGQHVYNCVRHTRIANSPRGKPPPNWDDQQRSCYFYQLFSSLRPAGFRERRNLRACLTTPPLEKMRDNFLRMGSSEISVEHLEHPPALFYSWKNLSLLLQYFVFFLLWCICPLHVPVKNEQQVVLQKQTQSNAVIKMNIF